jgi:serine/threonine-protein kinase RsbT
MQILSTTELGVRLEDDIVRIRHLARTVAVEAGLSIVDQTKFVTAASELARNTVIYGGGGIARVDLLEANSRRGVRITFQDQGPGIADVSLALRDGYTTGKGLGLGLSGAKRLCSEFELTSEPGKGTTVVITRWKG